MYRRESRVRVAAAYILAFSEDLVQALDSPQWNGEYKGEDFSEPL